MLTNDKITRMSEFTEKTCCYRCSVVFFMLLYLTAVLVFLYLMVDNIIALPFSYFYWLLLLPALNFVVIVLVGRYILSGILYPY